MLTEKDVALYREKLCTLLVDDLNAHKVTTADILSAIGDEATNVIIFRDRFPTIPELIKLCDLMGENLTVGWQREGATLYELTDIEWRLMRAIRSASMVETVMYLAGVYSDRIKDYLPKDTSDNKK